jgi:regulator of protease activity HflC (stomatin/prohibitin superfamily)
METAKAGVGCLVALAVAGLIAFFVSFVTVPAGSVGVVTHFGEVEGTTLPAGLHFMLPIVNTVHVIDTRVQSHEFGSGTQDNAAIPPIEAASREYQTVFLTGKFNYHIDGAYASVLYKTVGEDFAARIIDPAFKDIVKEIVPTYGISEILPHRDEIRSRTKDSLNANLARYHIVIDDIYLANVGFSKEYEAAIESKQVAQQQVETEKQITEQRKQQALQAVEKAKGEANAQIEQAKGDAAATEERARGQAEANRLIAVGLTPLLIQYTQIARLSPNVQVVYLPEGANFFLQSPVAK